MRCPGEFRAQRAARGRGAVRVRGADDHVPRLSWTDAQSASVSPEASQTLDYIRSDQKTLQVQYRQLYSRF